MWSTIGAARRNRGEQGFTLIEMMIVVAIIGVLASAAIPAFLRYMASARDVEGTHNTRKIGAAARAYFDTDDWRFVKSNEVHESFSDSHTCTCTCTCTCSAYDCTLQHLHT